ncbi:protein kinase [Acinetobacter sp. WU_MDCI_Axc73]|nr:protein kinase [Acinetobacter sp. WU_MDCI_Axc73]
MLRQFDQLRLKTKTKSMALGRRLYTFKFEGKNYWLKLQLQDSHATSKAGFEHELRFYQKQGSYDFVLPVQFLEINHFFQEELYKWGVVLPHADLYFTDQISSMTFLQTKQYMKKALQSLANMHDSGWIHGDLKAEHFVKYQEHVYLIDFEQSQQIKTQVISAITATPHYMAPELFHGSPKTIQSDLYAIGIILYEWLTARRFTASSYQDWAILHCQQLAIELPEDKQCFFPLLHGLLNKQPNLRYNDVNQALKVLNLTKMPI